jgi:uncharacterized membrane protein YeaQ/YmgE (transglycosylase-associated protein family)
MSSFQNARRTMEPQGIIIWLVIGAVAGWIAGQIVKGDGFGLIGNIVVGIIGSVIGGWVFGTYVVGTGGIVGAIIGSTIGAVILLFVLRIVRRA